MENSPGKKKELDGESNWNVVIDSDLAPAAPIVNNGTNLKAKEPPVMSIFEKL